MKAIRAYLPTVGAAIVGAAIGLRVTVYAWNRTVPLPRCDGATLPDGSFVIPMCAVPGMPLWWAVVGVAAGALLGVTILRLVRSRRSPDLASV